MSAEKITRKVFSPIVALSGQVLRVQINSAMVAIRSLLSRKDARSLLLAASSEDPKADRILDDFGTELKERLKEGFLMLIKGDLLKPIQRPQVLETYSYRRHVFLAVSERVMLTGKDGIVTTVEISHFDFLPRPNKTNSIEHVCDVWSTDPEVVQSSIKRHFGEHPHVEQEDIFRNDTFNFLQYDNSNRFVGCTPSPSNKPTSYLHKWVG